MGHTPANQMRAPAAVSRRRWRLVRPHMRGADLGVRQPILQAYGSPPHAWGRRKRHGVRVQRHRFTPTCVGQTLTMRTERSRVTVHPHMRGADHCNSLRRSHIVRFTPTCVGQTCNGIDFEWCIAVHPHMRGADAISASDCSRVIGSPPHAWGRRA